MSVLLADLATPSLDADLSLRLATVVMFVLAAAPYLRVAAGANRRGEKITTETIAREEGRLVLTGFKLTDACKGLGLVVWLINPAWMAWSGVPLPGWVRWAGIGFGVLVALWMAWTAAALRDNHTLSVVIRANHTLVTTGPYRWVRHPMYTANLMTAASLGLVTGNWFIAGAQFVQFLVIALLKVPLEEARLIEHFGEDYRRQITRTGRYFPKIV